MVNWQEYGSPFLDFTEEITQKWKKYFSKKETKEWLDVGLKAKDFDFARYLDANGKDPEECLNHGNIKRLRKEYNNNLREELGERREISESEEEEVKDSNKNIPRNNVDCNNCGKYIGNGKTAWFSDVEKDLDFCSEDCYSKWEKENWGGYTQGSWGTQLTSMELKR